MLFRPNLAFIMKRTLGEFPPFMTIHPLSVNEAQAFLLNFFLSVFVESEFPCFLFLPWYGVMGRTFLGNAVTSTAPHRTLIDSLGFTLPMIQPEKSSHILLCCHKPHSLSLSGPSHHTVRAECSSVYKFVLC